MPQSAEHLAAIDALGVRHGVLAITRADLADPGPALRQAARQIAGSSLGELGSRRGQRPHRPGPSRTDRRARQAHGAASQAGCQRPGPPVAGPGVRHQGQRDRDHRDLADRHRTGRRRADGGPGHAHRAGPGRAVARRTGCPGRWRRPGGAEPARRQHPGAGPWHGAHPARPLDRDQCDRRPPGAGPAARRRPVAAAACAAYRRGARHGPGADAGEPVRQADPGPPVAAARGRPCAAARPRRGHGPRRRAAGVRRDRARCLAAAAARQRRGRGRGAGAGVLAGDTGGGGPAAPASAAARRRGLGHGPERPAAAGHRRLAGRPGTLETATAVAGRGGHRARGPRPAGGRPSGRSRPGRTRPARPRTGHRAGSLVPKWRWCTDRGTWRVPARRRQWREQPTGGRRGAAGPGRRLGEADSAPAPGLRAADAAAPGQHPAASGRTATAAHLRLPAR